MNENQNLIINNEYTIKIKWIYAHIKHNILVYFEVIEIVNNNSRPSFGPIMRHSYHRGNLPRLVQNQGSMFWGDGVSTPPKTMAKSLCTNSWFGITQEDIERSARWRTTWK